MNMSAWKMTLINLNVSDLSHSMKNKMAGNQNLNLIDFIFLFFMWLFMMIAMMLPSAVPFIMMFDKISYERKKYNYKFVSTIYFILAYLFVWILFSLLSTILHFILEFNNIINTHTLSVGNLLGSFLFIFAGFYQMTPLKYACLKYCQNPIELLSNNKIFYKLGAFNIGIKHGIFCVGCCWPLMLLLFYSGIMNLVWIIGLSFYVIVEKYLFKTRKFNLLTGAILILIGVRIFTINYFTGI